MNNFRKRSKSKRDNLSEGGEGVVSMMEIEEQNLNSIMFWKDNKSWYQQPAFHHFSPQVSPQHSNMEEQQQYRAESDKVRQYPNSDVRSQIHLSQIKVAPRLSNKSQSFRDNLTLKVKTGIGCKCTKVNCLKRTCGCFDEGKYCGASCICTGCKNVEDNRSEIQKAKVEAKLRSNRSIFDNMEHEVPTKVCTCRKSRCRKKYCECFQAGVGCNEFCKCLDCLNMVENPQSSLFDNEYIEKSYSMKQGEKNMLDEI